MEAGLSKEAMKTVRASPGAIDRSDNILTPQQMAVVKFTDALTLGIRVSDEIWDGVKDYFSEKQLVELTASAAAFNTVTRFVTTLDVGEKNSSRSGLGELGSNRELCF